jgi:hypothetical protein
VPRSSLPISFSRRTLIRSFCAATALTLGLLGCGGSDNDDSPVESRCYASWTGSMLDATVARAGTTPPVAQVINDQSIRHVLRLSLGDDAIRLKVFNLFGKTPITFAGIQVARTTGGSSSDVASSRVVTFGSQPAVTVAAGVELLSEPVALLLPPLTDLAVTMYFATPTVVATVQALGRQTAFIGAGNQLAAASIPSATADQRQSYYGLTAVEASSIEKTNVMVTVGSIPGSGTTGKPMALSTSIG